MMISKLGFLGYWTAMDRNVCLNRLSRVSFRDRDALVALFDATEGDRLDQLRQLAHQIGPIGTWYGVTTVDGRVTKLELRGNSLTGSLPPEIVTSSSRRTVAVRQPVNW